MTKVIKVTDGGKFNKTYPMSYVPEIGTNLKMPARKEDPDNVKYLLGCVKSVEYDVDSDLITLFIPVVQYMQRN